jgi:hypothetical protein
MGLGFGSLSERVDSKIRFWYDMWCGEQTLEIAFSELFSIACFKGASVADILQLASDSRQWNVNFIRVAGLGGEFFSTFLDLLYSIRLRRDGEVRLCSAPFKRGWFDV